MGNLKKKKEQVFQVKMASEQQATPWFSKRSPQAIHHLAPQNVRKHSNKIICWRKNLGSNAQLNVHDRR